MRRLRGRESALRGRNLARDTRGSGSITAAVYSLKVFVFVHICVCMGFMYIDILNRESEEGAGHATTGRLVARGGDNGAEHRSISPQLLELLYIRIRGAEAHNFALESLPRKRWKKTEKERKKRYRDRETNMNHVRSALVSQRR